MTKTITLSGIFTVIILIAIIGSLPNGDVTDSKSVVKNAQNGLVTDTVVKAGGEAIEIVGDQAIDSACRDGASQGCSTTTTSVNMIGVAFAVLIIGVIVAGIIGVIKFGIKLIESF